MDFTVSAAKRKLQSIEDYAIVASHIFWEKLATTSTPE